MSNQKGAPSEIARAVSSHPGAASRGRTTRGTSFHQPKPTGRPRPWAVSIFAFVSAARASASLFRSSAVAERSGCLAASCACATSEARTVESLESDRTMARVSAFMPTLMSRPRASVISWALRRYHPLTRSI